MKNVSKLFLLVVVVALAGASCTPKAGNVALKNQNDTIAYTIGILTGEGLKVDDLTDLDPDLIASGIRDVLNEDTKIDAVAARGFFSMYMMQREEQQQKVQYKEVVERGEAFLAENKTKEGVIETESGLQYKVIRMGDGQKPTAENTVRVHYEGKLMDDTQFDSSYERGEPAEFPANRVISGWTEVLQLMPVGSEFMVYIPYNLGYGSRGNPQANIGPFEPLIFKIELLDIVN